MTGIRALLVDDDVHVRESLGAILKFLGCTVVACASGRQALERAGSRPLHLSFIDQQLTDDDGVSLLQRMQQKRIGGRKVLMSGHPVPMTGLPAEVELFMPKPIRLDDTALLLHHLQLITHEKLSALGLRHLARRAS